MRSPTGGDDRLLRHLERALTSPAVPTAADRDALRAHVLAARDIHRHEGRTARVRWSPLQRRMVAAVAAAFTLTAILYSATNPLPRPVRVVAHAIGLPVDSPDLVDARHRVTALREAIAAGDQPEIVERAADLRNQLRTLHRDDRATIEDEADDALADADHWLATRAGPPSGHPAEPVEPPHATPEAPTPPPPSSAPSTEGEHETQEPGQHTEPGQPGTTTNSPPRETEDQSTPSTTHLGEESDDHSSG